MTIFVPVCVCVCVCVFVCQNENKCAAWHCVCCIVLDTCAFLPSFIVYSCLCCKWFICNLWQLALVRNAQKIFLLSLCHAQVFQTLMVTDPLSQACVRPDYSAELTAWRVQLRPFLSPGGNLAEQRELESRSPDVQMCQSAVHLTEEGVHRRREFTVFNRGRGAANRASCPPHFLTAAERAHFEADSPSLLIDPNELSAWRTANTTSLMNKYGNAVWFFCFFAVWWLHTVHETPSNGKNGLVLSVTYTPCVHASSALLGNGLSKCLILLLLICHGMNTNFKLTIAMCIACSLLQTHPRIFDLGRRWQTNSTFLWRPHRSLSTSAHSTSWRQSFWKLYKTSASTSCWRFARVWGRHVHEIPADKTKNEKGNL